VQEFIGLIDPEKLTLVQLMWICFAILGAIFFICRWIYFTYPY